MGLESFVNVVLSATSGATSQASFGSILILGGGAANTVISADEVFREYSTLTALAEDFESTDEEYKLGARIFAQTPRAKSVLVGRRGTQHSQAFTFTPVVGHSTVYSFQVDGVTKTYTSDGTATAAEIVAGLAAVIPTGSGGFTVTQGATSLRAVGVAGEWHQMRCLTPSVLAMAQDGEETDVADDLDAIVTAGAEFYGVVTPFASREEVLAIAAWVEANRRFFAVTISDTAPLSGVYDAANAATDTGVALKAAAYMRTLPMWSASTDDFLSEGALGYLLGTNAGSVTLNLKTVRGATLRPLTSTQIANLKSRNMPVYVSVGGANAIERPTTAGGEWADVVRDTDEFVARTQEAVFTALRTANKVPFTDDGIAVITSTLGGRAQAGIGSGFLSNDADRKPVVSAPRASAVSADDRANRVLPDVTLTAYIAGAIHSVDPLTITFSV